MSQDYFRLMFELDIAPTNNHSEQQVRHCVIDRRMTQGTRSEAGQRYHERMWTAIATCGSHATSGRRGLREDGTLPSGRPAVGGVGSPAPSAPGSFVRVPKMPLTVLDFSKLSVAIRVVTLRHVACLGITVVHQ